MAGSKNILIGACGLGAATVCCLLIAVAQIINEIQSLESRLDVETDAFKVRFPSQPQSLKGFSIVKQLKAINSP